ncbi:MAG TPA: hypothetical protein VGJ26_06310 [Pirellulales bacterium]|jgi:hypothetical protein
MRVNFFKIFAKIEELAASEQTVNARMCEIIRLCSRDVQHADWAELSALDYDADVASLALWIQGVFERNPAPFPIQGLWIGLFNPCAGRKVWADMYVGALSQYTPDDDGHRWLWEGQSHYPPNADANSTSLRRIYEIGYDRTDGLGNTAEEPLCLAFGVFAVQQLLRGQSTRLVGSTAPRIGVVVGFDSGDMLKLGELTDNGFVDASKASL